jgi:glycosyltransferase involved in cell wall biosynthesis
MKPVRLLELIASSRGGGASHIYDLASRLDPQAFAVQVAMPEDGGNVTASDFARQGIRFHPVEIAGGFSVAAVGTIRRLLADVDLLHVHGARAALFGRLAAASLGERRPRIVYTIHGFAAPHYPPPRRQILLGVERALAPLVDQFIAVSHDEKNALVTAGVARPDQVSVVWNGIDVARFQTSRVDAATLRAELGLPVDTTVITTTCRLFKPRDFETLLKAMRQVVDTLPSVHLLIVGDGPLRAEIAAQAEALGLAQHVTLAGWRRDMPEIYAASDLFVLTTWGWEGLPLTVLEAMAAGKAVVASRAGGIPEIVVEGKTGLLVEQRNSTVLAEALAMLAGDAHRRRQLGRAGQTRVAEHFTLPLMVDKTISVYNRLIQLPSENNAQD